MMRNYFAYGSCTNLESFRGTMGKAGCADRFTILGVGVLKDYRLAFTRYSYGREGGVLDIVESPGDRVLGVVYSVPEEAVRSIDDREGHPNAYRRRDMTVSLGWEDVEVFTYTVVDKDMEEVEPSKAYVDEVLEGMRCRFPAEYVNRYLIGHLRERFGMRMSSLPVTVPYHFSPDEETRFQKENREFYALVLKIATYFGDEDSRAETVMPTPQMFRLLAKLTEIAARNRLDYGHLIPRGMHDALAREFSRISGVEVESLNDL